ncbi:MAG TPA: hypothetical protein VNA20_13215 [Frankiaceae bacterium]|nr:hypothetical protein [Frankiaceae bacterium]
MTTLMWEAVAAPGRVGEVVAWATALTAEGLAAKEVYVSADDRVVVIAHWRDKAAADGADLTPPPDTLARAPHAWRFTRVG